MKLRNYRRWTRQIRAIQMQERELMSVRGITVQQGMSDAQRRSLRQHAAATQYLERALECFNARDMREMGTQIDAFIAAEVARFRMVVLAMREHQWIHGSEEYTQALERINRAQGQLLDAMGIVLPTIPVRSRDEC